MVNLPGSFRRHRLPILLVILTVFAAGAAEIAVAKKSNRDPRCYKVKKKLFGKKGRDWAAEWWQWALSIPASENPLLDESGSKVEVGQRGPVWFLCGVYNESGTATRTATIPTGTALFFPILNTVWDNVGYENPYTADELLAFAAENVASFDLPTLKVILDGSEIRGIEKMRLASRPFRIWLPEGSVNELLSGGLYTKGIYDPVVTDGYWMMLKPLTAGEHTLRITGSTGGATPFVLDVTYHLTVIESDQP